MFGSNLGEILMLHNNNILDSRVLPTLWQQFVFVPFLFQHDMCKTRATQTWFSLFDVEELDRPAQSPDLTNALVTE